MDVARTIRKGLIDGYFDHLFGTRKLRHETGVVRDLRASIYAKPSLLFKVNEEHPDMRIDSEISQAHERAVAIVVREQERPVVDYPHKPGHPSSIVAVHPSLVIGGGQEEHPLRLDEFLETDAENIAHMLNETLSHEAGAS